ncbi:unnamed protein product [Trichogramma brassicae]|uniref:Glucose-methanol-choline oxidoreductase N-terminal domain-containing protein n=1 Tax=Trichogramma brassicae TaxID=86971 RepID=A0A6H5ICY9_9HYME|nr:unnamed protein product [Trichogramma brassicae]
MRKSHPIDCYSIKPSNKMTKWLLPFVILTLLSCSPRPCASVTIFDYANGLADFVVGAAGFVAKSLVYLSQQVRDTTPSQNQEYDFVIVGAGTAGATLAARLTEKPNVTVLLIEAGGYEQLIMDIPVLAILVMLNPLTNWGYKTERSNEYCLGMRDRRCLLPVGKVMGGSSSVNFMLATRGNENNYNKWARLSGDETWSYDKVLPYFKKLENFGVDLADYEDEYHGFDGPIKIVNPAFRSRMADAFVEAGSELGLPPRDYNGPVQQGMHYTQTNEDNGERVSSNRAYLIPAKGRANLHVSMNSHACKVLIDPESKLAQGLEFSKRSLLGFRRRIRVKARNEVILSAGALGTPKILMLSGVGPAEHLRQHGLPVLRDAPVGKNLIDHVTFAGMTLLVDEGAGLSAGDFLNSSNHQAADYFNARRTGPFTVDSGIENMGFVDIDQPTSTDTEPDVEISFGGLQLGYAYFFHVPFRITQEHWNDYFSHNRGKQGCLIWPTLLQPKSRGEILLSSEDPFDPPKILPNYMSHADDRRRLIKAVRLSQALANTESMKNYGSELYDRPVPGCEHHRWDSDGYWECAIRTYTISYWHFGGTCKMGKDDDPEAVLTSKLLVKGIRNLRVVDGSIMPTVPSAHTNLPILMIAEKMADVIKKDWNLD